MTFLTRSRRSVLLVTTVLMAGSFPPSWEPRLVSIDPLPVLVGALCAMPGVMAAALQDGPAGSRPGSTPREPIRTIRDLYPSFSAVAVDPIRDEVVVTDENLFQVMVYDRTTTGLARPTRVIGGDRTDVEFQVGVYIDPKTGEIFAINNDTQDKLVIFNREAKGNVRPTRFIETPHGTFGIAVDESRQELFLTVQHDSAVVVYRKSASGDEPPLRLLQGDRTRLADPHGIAVDEQRGLLFVANFGSTHSVSPDEKGGPYSMLPSRQRSPRPNWPLDRGKAVPGSGRFLPPSITVYARDAHGDVAPLRTIAGDRTRLNWPTGVAVDPVRGELFVANDVDSSILVFDADAHGNAAPLRVIKGPKTGIKNPTGVFLDAKNNELWVANFGGHSLGVFRPTADGDVAPLRTLRSAPEGVPSLMIGNPGAVAFDTKRGEILVPN